MTELPAGRRRLAAQLSGATLLLLLVWLPGSKDGLDTLTPLVEPRWLAERIGDPSLAVLDIRNAIGGADRSTYEAGHIPGSVYSDYVGDAWHDHDSRAPVTLPAVEQLETLLERLGISNRSTVVIVHSGTDSSDFSTAARVYWIFQLLGHDRVAILDGGYRAWVEAGMPVERGWNEPRPAVFIVTSYRDALIGTTAEVEDARRRGAQLVDARAPDLYEGWIKAPLAARAGTIPGAINLAHRTLIDADTGRFVEMEALLAILRETGIDDPTQEVVTFCSIGHWSSAVWFALREIAGFDNVTLYDGSMVEWSASPERPVIMRADPLTE